MNEVYIPNFMMNIKVPKDRITILSCEGLSGHPGFNFNECNREKIAKRLHTLFPYAKIILVTRKEDAWVRSLYKQYVNMGGSSPYDKWRQNNFDERYLDFEGYIKYLRNIFDEVLVLDFQSLKDNPHEFIKNICDFMNVNVPNYQLVSENVSMTDNQINAIINIRNMKYLPKSIRSAACRFIQFF